jgi:lipooligosaccharide transport system permease protein
MRSVVLGARVVEREARVYKRLWRGSIISQFVAPLMFLGAMGLGLGSLVDDNSGGVDGLTYLVFVTPGILAATTASNAAGESLWPVMTGTTWLRTYHGLVATPLRPSDVYGGELAWMGVRAVLHAVIVLGVAWILGGLASPWAVLAVPAAVLTALSFGAPLVAFACGQSTDMTFPVIMRLVVQPLFLFSGTFFPVSDLPTALQKAVWFSPLYHGVELCRAATTGEGDPAALVAHTLILVAVIAAGGWWGVRTFTGRLAP